jgi:hypothetical protein
MARYNDRECAWCANDLDRERYLIGIDHKVYCSAACAESGARLLVRERENAEDAETNRNREKIISLP